MAAGDIDLSFIQGTGFNHLVEDIILTPDNKYLIGGYFTEYNGTVVNHIIKLNLDGSIDTSFNSGTGFSPTTIKSIVNTPDNKYLIGGSFTGYNGAVANHIIKLNLDGSIDTSFNVHFNRSIQKIIVTSDNKYLIGGTFTEYNGNISTLIKLNLDGSIDTSFDTIDGFKPFSYFYLQTLIETTEGYLVGGDFTEYKLTSVNRLMRLKTDGSIDTTFNAGGGFVVNSSPNHIILTPDNKYLIVYDGFTYDGQITNGIVKINLDGSIDTTFLSGTGLNPPVNTYPYGYSILISNNKYLIVGNFSGYDGTPVNGVVRINLDGTIDNTFNINPDSSKYFSGRELIEYNDKYLIGGYFTEYNGTVVNHIVRVDAITTYSYTLTPTSHDYGTSIQGESEGFQLVEITNTGNEVLNLTITDSTNFYSDISSISIDAGQTSGVTIFAKTNNVGIHNENILFAEPNAGNQNFNGQSEILEKTYSYTLTPTSHDYGTLIQGTVDPSQIVNIENTGNQILNLTITDSTNFYSDISSISIDAGQTSGITIFAKTNNVGIHNENIVFSEPNAGNQNFNGQSEITINVLLPTKPLLDTIVPFHNIAPNSGVQFVINLTPDWSNADTIGFYGRLSGGTWEQVEVVSSAVTSQYYSDSNNITFSWDNTINNYEWKAIAYNVSGKIESDIVIFPKTATVSGIKTSNSDAFTVVHSDYALDSGNTLTKFIIFREKNGISDGSIEYNGSPYIPITTAIQEFTPDTPIKTPTQDYSYRVEYVTGSGLISPLYQGQWGEIGRTQQVLRPYCSIETPYTVINEVGCGSSTGSIEINQYLDYKDNYNFLLKDIDDNIYIHDSNGVFNNLTANYYHLEAIPTGSIFRDTCLFDFIELNDDSGITLNKELITNAICGSFNQEKGRIVLEFSQLGQYTYKLYDFSGKLIKTDVTIGDLILEDLVGGQYYLVVNFTSNSCSFLYNFRIEEENLLSVPNIQKIFITKWSDNFNLTYWSTFNDPNYYGSLDTLKFQSTKIESYDDDLIWYKIIVDEQNVNFSQALSKVRQGFIFDDVLTIGIPYHDTDKWNALKQVIEDRWVVVFQDANDNWWTFGYKHGAQAEDYTFGSELAGFTLGFKAVSENKIITALDEEYINREILDLPSYYFNVVPNTYNFGILNDTTPFVDGEKIIDIINDGEYPLEISVIDSTNFKSDNSLINLPVSGQTQITVSALTINDGYHSEEMYFIDANAPMKKLNLISNINVGNYGFSIDPISNFFGSIAQDDQPETIQIKVTNKGTITIDIAIAPTTNFAVDKTSVNLSFLQSELITVSALTTNAGLFNEQIIFSNPNTGNQVFEASSEILPKTFELEIEPNPAFFGTNKVNEPAIVQDYTVTNIGNQDLTNIVVTSPTAFSASTSLITSLDVGQSVVIQVAGLTDNYGRQDGIITFVPDQGSLGELQCYSVIEDYVHSFFLTPISFHYGSLVENDPEPSTTVVVTNDGEVDLIINITDPNNFYATVDTFTLLTGATETITIKAKTTSTAYHNEVLKFNDSTLKADEQLFNTISDVNPAVYALNPVPISHNFGTLLEGGTEPTTTFLVENIGNRDLSVTLNEISLTNFSTSPLSFNLPVGNSQTVTATALTNNAGTFTEYLGIDATNAVSKTFKFDSIVATATYSYTLSPTTNDFGNIQQGDNELSKTFTLTNTGNQTLVFSFTNTTNFYRDGVGTVTVTAGNSATISIKAKTDVFGGHSETLIITEPNASNTNVPLTSNITSPLGLSQGSYQFGYIEQYSFDPQGSITITNNSDSTDYTIVLGDNTNFYWKSTTPLILNAGTTKTIQFAASAENLGLHKETLALVPNNGVPSLSLLVLSEVVVAIP